MITRVDDMEAYDDYELKDEAFEEMITHLRDSYARNKANERIKGVLLISIFNGQTRCVGGAGVNGAFSIPDLLTVWDTVLSALSQTLVDCGFPGCENVPNETQFQ